MLQTVADEIESKTQIFWELSRIRNGHSTRTMSTSTALHLLSDVVDETNPARPIVRAAKMLRHEIIVDVPRAIQPISKTLFLRKREA